MYSNRKKKNPIFKIEKNNSSTINLAKILNDETIYNIVALDFMKQAENFGRSQAVSAATHFGTTSPNLSIELALANGLLISAQENYKEAFQNSKLKR